MFQRLSAWWHWSMKFVLLPVYVASLLFWISTWITEMNPSQRSDKLGEGLREGLVYGAAFVVQLAGALLNAVSHSSE